MAVQNFNDDTKRGKEKSGRGKNEIAKQKNKNREGGGGTSSEHFFSAISVANYASS